MDSCLTQSRQAAKAHYRSKMKKIANGRLHLCILLSREDAEFPC